MSPVSDWRLPQSLRIESAEMSWDLFPPSEFKIRAVQWGEPSHVYWTAIRSAYTTYPPDSCVSSEKWFRTPYHESMSRSRPKLSHGTAAIPGAPRGLTSSWSLDQWTGQIELKQTLSRSEHEVTAQTKTTSVGRVSQFVVPCLVRACRKNSTMWSEQVRNLWSHWAVTIIVWAKSPTYTVLSDKMEITVLECCELVYTNPSLHIILEKCIECLNACRRCQRSQQHTQKYKPVTECAKWLMACSPSCMQSQGKLLTSSLQLRRDTRLSSCCSLRDALEVSVSYKSMTLIWFFICYQSLVMKHNRHCLTSAPILHR